MLKTSISQQKFVKVKYYLYNNYVANNVPQNFIDQHYKRSKCGKPCGY